MPGEKVALVSSGILTVSQLAREIQGVLDEGLDGVWVVGEISNFRPAASGHCFFTLKDEHCQISTVLFRSAAARLRFRPSDGLEVVAFGRVRFYDARGALQLYVQSLEPRGLGALRQQLEQLRERLRAEGLLDPARKRPLPFLPRCVGIVTALGGAAIQDMLRMLRDRNPNLRIVVRSVRVQGLGSELEIADGLRDLQGVADVEVILLGRGGGSAEDLWAFNDEGLARAIVASRVPVVSAVGHEIDVTIADLVADVRAATPSAAAELVTPRKRDIEKILEVRRYALTGALRRRLVVSRGAVRSLHARLRDPRRDVLANRLRTTEAHRRLVRGFLRATNDYRDRIGRLEHRLRSASPTRTLTESRGRLRQARQRLEICARHRVEVARGRFGAASASLAGLSPLAVLSRGYAVVWKLGEGRAIRSATEVCAGDAVEIRLHRGCLRATVGDVLGDRDKEPSR